MPFGNARGQGFNNPAILNFQVANIVLDKLGLFFYSGKPGPGNPPIAWMSNGNVDSFGNTLSPLTGFTPIIGAGSDGNPQVILSEVGGFGVLTFPVPGTFTRYAEITGNVSGSGEAFQVLGAADTTQEAVGFEFSSRGVNGVSATAFLTYFDSAGGQHTQLVASLTGLQLPVVQSLSAVLPGTGTSTLNPAAPESWHTMALGNGWVSTAGFRAAQYRLVPGNLVEIDGTISGTAATSANFFDLPAGYQPGGTNVRGYAIGATGGVPAGSAPNVRCTGAGALTIVNAGAFPLAQSYFIHGFISLDP